MCYKVALSCTKIGNLHSRFDLECFYDIVGTLPARPAEFGEVDLADTTATTTDQRYRKKDEAREWSTAPDNTLAL